MSGAVDRLRSTARRVSFDGRPTYRDAWRAAGVFALVGVAYAAVYFLVGDRDFAAFLGLAVPLVGVAFTLGVAAARREWRHVGLSVAVGTVWAGLLASLGPVRSVVAELPWLGLFFGWLVVVFALLGFAAPGFARLREE